MKITDFKKEDLEKGIMIRRKEWSKDISISFNKNASIFDAHINGVITGDKTDLLLEDIISDDWEIVEENQYWKPKKGNIYYYITTSGDVAQNTFSTFLDEYRLSFRNVFKTTEDARKMVEKIKIINKLRELSNTRSIYNQDKFIIYYNFQENKVSCGEINYAKFIPFEVCFKTREDCQKAIDTIGEDNLKKYYFDIAEVEEDN